MTLHAAEMVGVAGMLVTATFGSAGYHRHSAHGVDHGVCSAACRRGRMAPRLRSCVRMLMRMFHVRTFQTHSTYHDVAVLPAVMGSQYHVIAPVLASIRADAAGSARLQVTTRERPV